MLAAVILFAAAVAALWIPHPVKELAASRCVTGAGEIVRQELSLKIDGFIDKPMYECFRSLYSSDVNIVEVRSSGGVPEYALSIAELLVEHRPTVRIHDYCASACAYLFLPVASKIETTSPSIILFHHTATSTYESLGDKPTVVSTRFKRLSDREISLYARLKVSQWLLRAPFAAQEPICEILNVTTYGLPSANYKAYYKAILIDKKLLAQSGIKLPGLVVGNLKELLAVASTFQDKGAALLSGGIGYLEHPSKAANTLSSSQYDVGKLPLLPICAPEK